MHCRDFVLIVRNMFERYHAVSVLWLHARSSLSTSNYGEMFSQMDTDLLQQVASRCQQGYLRANPPGEPITTEVAFLQSVNAVAKSMAHTAQAAMKSRSEMFAYCKAIFFTVTPGDNCNLSFSIMSNSQLAWNDCNMSFTDPDDILEEFQSCGQVSLMFPGLCALNFQ